MDGSADIAADQPAAHADQSEVQSADKADQSEDETAAQADQSEVQSADKADQSEDQPANQIDQSEDKSDDKSDAEEPEAEVKMEASDTDSPALKVTNIRSLIQQVNGTEATTSTSKLIFKKSCSGIKIIA